MDLTQPKISTDNVLSYEPIKFVYTETIGSVLEKFKEIVDPYTWTYEDILQPKILTNPSKVQYYLFHIAPIYNWLRKVESNILSNYISLGQKGGNAISLSKPTFRTQKEADFKRFDSKAFLTEINHYLSQWQIVKLCASAKVKIITTKTDELMAQGNHKFSKNQNPNKKQAQMRCTHMIKKQKFTSEYKLNDFTPSNIKLQCNKVFCDECQEFVKVKSQISKYPFAPYFQKYYGKEFSLNENTSSKLTYQLTLVYGQEKTYVKTSGGVWYEVSREKTSIVSFDKIEVKTGLLFIYQQALKSNKVLRKVQSIKIKENSFEKLQQLSLNTNEDEESGDLHQIKQQKLEKPKQVNSKASNQKPEEIQVEAKDDEVLEDMSKNPLPIILNKKTTDRKLFKEYKKTVQGLLPKQRQKDEYEKNYDKGKTKKIHKNRQQFRTADFFKLYTDIKQKNNNPHSSKNQNEDGQDFQKKENHHQKHNGPYREKDEEYNEVYQDRRGQRRNHRNFKGKLGNKFSNDRQSNSKGNFHPGKKNHLKKFKKGGFGGNTKKQ